MKQKNRCLVKRNNRRCKKYVAIKNNPHQKKMCASHMRKYTYCCFCGEECNPMSQSCGKCARGF